MRRPPVSVGAVLSRIVRAAVLFLGIAFEYALLALRRRLVGPERAERAAARVHRRCALRLRRGALRLAGVYIKVGQAVSMMTSFLPPVYVEELETLQDAVPPHPFEQIRATLEAELAAPVEEVFTAFDESPIASASFGQVHLARLRNGDGTDVAVKVQYPGLDRIVRADLWVVRQVLRVLEWFFPHSHYERLHHDLDQLLHRELDYEREGRNAETLAANFAGEDVVAFPAIHWKTTTTRVLTMERMQGVKITDVAGIRALGLDPAEVVRILVDGYLKQLLVDRTFHADPHPGNFLVRRRDAGGPCVVFLDFGAVETIGPELATGMRHVVRGYMAKDATLVVEGIRTMGFRSAAGSDDVFDTAVRYYFEKVLDLDVKDYSRIDLSQFRILENLEEMRLSLRELTRVFQIPLSWFYVERTLLLLLELCALLAPTVNILEIGFPYLVRFVFSADESAGLDQAGTDVPP